MEMESLQRLENIIKDLSTEADAVYKRRQETTDSDARKTLDKKLLKIHNQADIFKKELNSRRVMFEEVERLLDILKGAPVTPKVRMTYMHFLPAGWQRKRLGKNWQDIFQDLVDIPESHNTVIHLKFVMRLLPNDKDDGDKYDKDDGDKPYILLREWLNQKFGRDFSFIE